MVILIGFLLAVFAALALGLQSVGPSEQRRRLANYQNIFGEPNVVIGSGTWTSPSPDVTLGAANPLILPGMLVFSTGSGIQANTTVLSVTGTALVLSQPTLSSGSSLPMAFIGPPLESGATAQVHLFAAPFTGGSDPTPADFTEATFDGYASLRLGAGTGVYSQPNGTAENDFGDFSWVLTSTPVVTNIIYGYWVDYSNPLGTANDAVAVWESFPAPINMAAIGNAVVFTIPFTLPLPSAATQP